jgi:hypothetical protein
MIRRRWLLGMALAVLVTMFCTTQTVRADDNAKSDLLERRPCGPDNIKGPLRYLIPQGFGRADFRGACNHHDNCYDDPQRTQKHCDDQFYRDMLTACESSHCKIGCKLTAFVMYRAVVRFGASHKTGG